MPGIVTSRTRRLYSRPPGPPYTLNRDDPQARGLLAWWPLGEASPAGYIDYASNSRVWVPGTSPDIGGGPDGGYAPLFTGTQSLKLTAPVVTAYPFTVLVWGNPSSVSGSKTIWSEADEATTNNIWQMYLSNASFVASVSAAGAEQIATAGNSAVANVWNSFIYRAVSATSRDAILNGNIASKGNNTVNRTPTGLDNTVLGMLQTSAAATNFFSGRLAHACIWGVALSDDEVWATYDPETRWNLYYPLGKKTYSFALPVAFPFARKTYALAEPPENPDFRPFQQKAVNRVAALFAGGFLTPSLTQAVRSTSVADSSSIGNTYGSNTTANGFLVAVLSVSNENSLTVTPPTNWFQADVSNNGTQSKTYIFYRWNAPSVSSATTLTFTFGATALSATLHLLEFTNVDNTADPLDKHTPATGSGTTPTTGTTGATSQTVELVLAALGTSAAGTFSSPSSPYLIGGQASEGVEGLNSSAALWRTTTTTGTQQASATHSSGGSNATVIATFKAAGGAPVTPDSPTGGRRVLIPAVLEQIPIRQQPNRIGVQGDLIAQQAPPSHAWIFAGPNPEIAGWPIVPRPPLSAQADLVAQQALYRRPVSTFLPEPEMPASLWWGVRGTFPQIGPTPPIGDTPPPRQFQQPVWEPPDPGDVWWRVQHKISWQSLWIAQNPPPTKQPSQRMDPILDLAIHSWWQIRARWPIPETYIPPIDAPPTRQRMIVPPPREDPTTDYSAWDTLQIRQRFLNPFPFRGAVDSYGFYRILNPFALREEAGRYRIAGIAGYAIYVGIGVLPNLTGAPTVFSTTLPASVPVTPPGVGTTTFHVVVRYRDVYGLESQNQKDYSVTIDSSGNLVLPPISVPQNVQAVFMSGGVIRVLANYPTINTDEYPADQWQVWIGAAPPVPGVDPPTRTSKAGKNLAVNFVNYLSGTWYLTVALYRTADTALSPSVQKTVVIPAAPDEPGSTHGGYEIGY